MDPLTAGIALPLLSNFLGSIFAAPAVGPSGPTTAQIAALLARQKSESDASRNAWLIGLGLASVGAVVMVVMLGRK
jgi:hypothetical protein